MLRESNFIHNITILCVMAHFVIEGERENFIEPVIALINCP